MSKPKIAVIAGPTACGKTALSIALCKRLGGEAVCADSMQIYRGMEIGTAAPDEQEKEGVPHHLFGFVPPDRDFSLAEYIEAAKNAITEILSRGALPVLVGGTGLYIETLLNGIDLAPTAGETGLRAELEASYDADRAALFERLKQVDLQAVEKLHVNDKRRIVRALEIYLATGKTKTQRDLESKKALEYDARVIILNYLSRSTLYDKIGSRVDIMIKKGLKDEADRLFLSDKIGKTASQAIGYKEFFSGLAQDQAVELIKKNSRNYAKRQITYFRRFGGAARFYVDEMSFEQLVAASIKHIEGDEKNV